MNKNVCSRQLNVYLKKKSSKNFIHQQCLVNKWKPKEAFSQSNKNAWTCTSHHWIWKIFIMVVPVIPTTVERVDNWLPSLLCTPSHCFANSYVKERNISNYNLDTCKTLLYIHMVLPRVSHTYISPYIHWLYYNLEDLT